MDLDKQYRIFIINHGMSALKFLLSMMEWRASVAVKLTIIGIVTDDDMISGYNYINYLDEAIHAPSGIYMNSELLLSYA